MNRTNLLQWYALSFLIFATIMFAIYAVSLNHLYYSVYGPFYDSVGYANQLAVVMGASKDNLLAGITAIAPWATVMLPWLEGALLAQFTTPTRDLAVWLQAPWLVAQVVTAFFYFRDFIKYPVHLAAAFALVLGSFQAVFFFNGGLSDLRMDLLQALTFGSALAIYFVARARGTWLPWIIFGMLIGICCLARATSPVYIVLVFSVFALRDIIPAEKRMFFLSRYAAAAAVAAVVALWFYVLGFERLYFYYFVWNADATSRLPLRDSVQHFEFFVKHVGPTILLLAGASFVVQVALRIRKGGSLSRFNWRALWAGIAPIGFLVGSGAGPNPFVSLISVPGALLFLLAPFRADRGDEDRAVAIPLVAGALVACLLTAAQGVAGHSAQVWSWMSRRDGLDLVVRRMLDDVGTKDGGFFRFLVAYYGALYSDAIVNSLVYDHGFRLDPRWCLNRGNLAFRQLNIVSQPTEWAQLPATSEQEKVQSVATYALSYANYLIIPEEQSKLGANAPINEHAVLLRRLLLESGRLVALGGPIQVSGTETVSLYRNTAQLGAPIEQGPSGGAETAVNCATPGR